MSEIRKCTSLTFTEQDAGRSKTPYQNIIENYLFMNNFDSFSAHLTLKGNLSLAQWSKKIEKINCFCTDFSAWWKNLTDEKSVYWLESMRCNRSEVGRNKVFSKIKNGLRNKTMTWIDSDSHGLANARGELDIISNCSLLFRSLQSKSFRLIQVFPQMTLIIYFHLL